MVGVSVVSVAILFSRTSRSAGQANTSLKRDHARVRWCLTFHYEAAGPETRT